MAGFALSAEPPGRPPSSTPRLCASVKWSKRASLAALVFWLNFEGKGRTSSVDISVLDLGSHSFQLLCARVSRFGKVERVHKDVEYVQLIRHVTNDGALDATAFSEGVQGVARLLPGRPTWRAKSASPQWGPALSVKPPTAQSFSNTWRNIRE